MIAGMLRDLRFALRLLGRNPGFAGVAMVTLALGIGANTAIFSLVYGVLLRPLPYPEAGRLMQIEQVFPAGRNSNTDGVHALFWKEHQHTMSSVAIVGGEGETNLAGGSAPERVAMSAVTADFFRTLRLAPVIGRDFAQGEDTAAAPVAILSHSLWMRHFGGDASALGRAVTLG